MKKTLNLNKKQMESIEKLTCIIKTLKSEDDSVWEESNRNIEEFVATGAAEEMASISEEALWGLQFAISMILDALDSSKYRKMLDNAHEQIGIAGEYGAVTSVVEAFSND